MILKHLQKDLNNRSLVVVLGKMQLLIIQRTLCAVRRFITSATAPTKYLTIVRTIFFGKHMDNLPHYTDSPT